MTDGGQVTFSLLYHLASSSLSLIVVTPDQVGSGCVFSFVWPVRAPIDSLVSSIIHPWNTWHVEFGSDFARKAEKAVPLCDSVTAMCVPLFLT